MKFFLTLFILLLCTKHISSYEEPERETRAVWVTTNFALDWPPNTYDEIEQKSALENIFIDVKNKKFNTIYFQVRSNGTVLYNSEIEPFSPYLTGQIGLAPNYDPLQYAIELGRKYGLEVHAWVNMIRCFSGSDDRFLKHPKHVRNLHPEFTSRVMDDNGNLSYWLNPGYYKSQDYLVDLLIELTSNYDLDGIQLDFFRYPGPKFEDEKYFKDFNLNITLGDWRRNNLSTILRKFKLKANPKNSLLKIGATPIGIRKSLNGANGWEGYSMVFQDTETWLKEELVDYLVPQIYWNFEDNPRFDVLASDWVDKSYNKNILLGLAAYKKEVKPELNQMINFSKEIGAAGISIFRYSFISSESDNLFDDISFPKNMPWKESLITSPTYKIDTKYNEISNDEVLIEWTDTLINSEGYFRNYVLMSDNNIVKSFSLDKSKLKMKFGKPTKLLYSYKINKLDRLWNSKPVSDELKIAVPFLRKLKNSSGINISPMLYKESERSALLTLFSQSDQVAQIDIFNIENLGRQERTDLKQGINIIQLEGNWDQIKTIKITYSNSGREEELYLF